jgi:hypothetical protein
MDLEKAYDHVNWDFLLYMLRRCAFGGKWCSWIAHCISNLIPVGNVDQMEWLDRILGCGVAILPMKYLGIPLGASYKSTHIWEGVIDKIEHRLTSWKRLIRKIDRE